MKLLFIQGGTRVKVDNEGNCYTDGNFTEEVWDRYRKYSDELVVLLRREDKVYDKEFAEKSFNKFLGKNAELITVSDLNKPMTRNLNIILKRQVDKKIEDAVKQADKIILRSILNHYTLTALKYCRKYKKDYLVEVAGFAFDGYWYHGDLKGKLAAIPYEFIMKSKMKNVPYAVYVTNEALQKRYPCYGKTLGCSDVEIDELNEKVLQKRINRYSKEENKIVLGTIGWINLKLKGQQDVIRAIYELKKKGINNFEYQLVGAGKSDRIEKLIKKYKLEKEIKIIGPLPHNEVFEWLENVDVYIQASYQEGLCRSIVEAMSKGCPVIASDVGGNYELIDNEYIFKKGNVKALIKILRKLTSRDLQKQAQINFNKSKEYEKSLLNEKRNKFYFDFINN